MSQAKSRQTIKLSVVLAATNLTLQLYELMSCAILFIIPCFSVTDACNPRHHYRHVLTEEGKQPTFYPVDDYSSCCPPAEQRISHVQVENVTIPGGGSQWLPEYMFGLSIASVKNNQIELNVRNVFSKKHQKQQNDC